MSGRRRSRALQLVLMFGRTGNPSAARIVADTTRDAVFEACVASAALRARYIGNDMGAPNRYRMRLTFEHEPDRAKRPPGARDHDWFHRRARTQ